MWPDTRLLDLLGIEIPIVQAPMANSTGIAIAVAVANAGALGSLPCAMLKADDVRARLGEIRQRTNRPVNLNFFCNEPPTRDAGREAAWLEQLAPYYTELGAEPPSLPLQAGSVPFDGDVCAVVEEMKPAAVSFHFGLPVPDLVDRVKRAGCKVLCSATSVREARFLYEHGADVIIAQGAEAGGHRGMFLETDVATQIGTFALVPQIVDAVPLPVIAAGGIADGRGVAAAFALGASGVQMGTAYLRCPEAEISDLYRAALRTKEPATAITNVLTGRPARAILNRFIEAHGPVNPDVPSYPLPTQAVVPLRKKAEEQGSRDFSPHWSGQARALGRDLDAETLTKTIAEEALERLRALAR